MSAILDRSQRTATPHVISLLVEDGRHVAQCHCGWRRSVAAQAPQDQRAAYIRREVDLHLTCRALRTGAVLALVLVAWSLVMSQPVYSMPIGLTPTTPTDSGANI